MHASRATSTIFVLLLAMSILAIGERGVAGAASDRAHRVRGLVTLDAEDLNAYRWSYARFHGKVTLVDFWATWCAPCLRELPYLRRARDRFGDRFEILGVSLDRMPEHRLRAWLRRQDVVWPQIHARGGFDDALARSFGIDRLPSNMLVGPDGRVHDLDLRGEALLEAVTALIDSRDAASR